MEDYNGFSNWDTNEVDTWIQNEEGLYSFFMGLDLDDPDTAEGLEAEVRLFFKGRGFDIDLDAVDWQEIIEMNKE